MAPRRACLSTARDRETGHDAHDNPVLLFSRQRGAYTHVPRNQQQQACDQATWLNILRRRRRHAGTHAPREGVVPQVLKGAAEVAHGVRVQRVVLESRLVLLDRPASGDGWWRRRLLSDSESSGRCLVPGFCCGWLRGYRCAGRVRGRAEWNVHVLRGERPSGMEISCRPPAWLGYPDLPITPEIALKEKSRPCWHPSYNSTAVVCLFFACCNWHVSPPMLSFVSASSLSRAL